MNLGGAGGTTRGDEEEQAKETKEGQSVSKEGKTKTKKKGVSGSQVKEQILKEGCDHPILCY